MVGALEVDTSYLVSELARPSAALVTNIKDLFMILPILGSSWVP